MTLPSFGRNKMRYGGKSRRARRPCFSRPLVEVLETRRLLSGSSPGAGITSQTYGQLPLSFEPNQGQTDASVQFLSHGSNYALFLTPTEAVLSLQKQPKSPALHGASSPGAVVSMQLVDANPAAQGQGLDELRGKSNYLNLGASDKRQTNIPNYGRVEYRDVYPGIDVIYHGGIRQLEYDFVVASGADPEAIVLNFAGADGLEVNAQGELVVHAAGGDVVEQAPVLYQEIGGHQQAVAGRYVLKGGDQAGFQVGPYDAAAPLVIDPVLVYSTYFGGTDQDVGNSIAVDAKGNAYIVGTTGSINFPVKNASLQPFFNGYGSDAFIAKLDPDGNRLFATYFGGNPDETQQHEEFDQFIGSRIVGTQYAFVYGNGIAVDKDGQIYVTGTTLQFKKASLDESTVPFPTTTNAFQNTPKDTAYNAFVAKLKSDGTTSLYVSYYSAQKDDTNNPLGLDKNTTGVSIAVDKDGNVYFTGSDSPEFTNLPSSLITTHTYVVKLDLKGGKLSSTILGDDGTTASSGITVDAAGNAYVVGTTNSTDFATVTPAQVTDVGGTDAFVAKVTPDGKLGYAVRIGGSGSDNGNAIAADAAGDVYITGTTDSVDFAQVNNFQFSLGNMERIENGGGNAFVAKLDPTGKNLLYSTFLGGSVGDAGLGIAVDSTGHAYVTGVTHSPDFPVANAIQPKPGGRGDAFVTKLDVDGSGLLYSTYLGGGGDDSGHGIAVDSLGNAYITGRAGSAVGPGLNFPVTDNAFQKTFGGGVGLLGDSPDDAFVTKISAGLRVVAKPVRASKGVPFTQTVATFNDPDFNRDPGPFGTYEAAINWGDGTPISQGNITQPGGPGTDFQVAGSHTYVRTGAFPVVVTVHDRKAAAEGRVDEADATTAYDVSQAKGNQSETNIAVNPFDPSRVFSISNDEQGAAAAYATKGKAGGLFAAFSMDGGITWRPSNLRGNLIATGTDNILPALSDPQVAFDQFGNLFLTYVSAERNHVVVALSTDDGATFTQIGLFSPAGSSLNNTSVDQPSIATGPGNLPGTQSVWITFIDLIKNTIEAAGTLVMRKGEVRPFNSAPEIVPDSAGGNFGSVTVGPSGQVLVDWQDNASYDGSTDVALGPDHIFVSLDPDGLGDAGFSKPVLVTSTNVGGRKPVVPQFTRKIDAEANLAWDRSGGPHNGRVYLSYTDATDPMNLDTLLEMRHSDDNGATWSDPVRIDDTKGQFTLFLPSNAVDQITGDVAVAWYDTRNDPNDKKTQFFTAVSSDGGQSFSANVPVSIGSSDATDPKLNPDGKANQYGDYTGLAFYRGILYPAWADNSPQLSSNPDRPQFDLAVARVMVAHVGTARPTVTALPVPAVEGKQFFRTVAKFTDPDTTLTSVDFSAIIDWGDGSKSSDQGITVGADGKTYEVSGGHTYAKAGAYPIVVTVTDHVNGVSATTAVDVSQTAGYQGEGTVAINPKNASQVFAASNSAGGGLFGATSSDGGVTWSGRIIGDASGTGGLSIRALGDPKAVFDQFGNLFLTYVDITGTQIVVAASTDGGQNFTILTPPFADSGGVDQPSIATGPGLNGQGGAFG